MASWILTVAPIILGEIAIAIILGHRGVHVADFVDVLIGDALAGEFAGERFQLLTDLKKILHVLGGELGCA